MIESNSITKIIILVVGLVLAVVLGSMLVTDQADALLWVAGASVLTVCISLGRRIWLLIPFMAALSIQLRLPGQPSTLLLAQILALSFCTLLFLMRKLPFRLAFTELEFWAFVLTAFVVQVYIRNPVGVNIFGGDSVGGKPYAIYGITLATGLLLSGLRVPAGELKWYLRLSILGSLLNLFISVAGTLVPSIAYFTGAGFEDNRNGGDADMGKVVDSGAATRVGFLTEYGGNAALWISSFISPVKALVRPLWLLLVLSAVVAAMLGGFRNGVIGVGVTFLLGIAYRSGFPALMMSIIGATGGLALLAVVNVIHPLPPNIQRSLTFLPGTWEERYKVDADGSTEWRIEIWKEALLTERWIKNKWIGDGLGFSAAELAAQLNDRKGARAGISGFEGHRESVLANGDYHSGPVSTIRVIGYVGLFFFLLAQIRMGVHAHRQIIRCRGTEWYPLALFIGIPLISGPLFFVFVFGDFKSNAAAFLLSAGICRLLQNNLPLPAYVARRREPYILKKQAIQATQS
ncbi:MAG: hypothetical protein ABIT37_10005 [Luteolibacter sp.]